MNDKRLIPRVGGDALQPIVDLVLDSLGSEHSRRAYRRALTDFLAWCVAQGRPRLTKATVQAYRAQLLAEDRAPSSTNLRLSAVRKLAAEAADNGLIEQSLANGIARVRGVKSAGQRTGNWLTKEQAQQLLDAPDVATVRGQRDRAMLAVMLGAGLRRSEVASLTVEHVQQRDGRWVIVDLVGKGNRIRSVPLPSWAKAALDAWTMSVDISAGRLFRALDRAGALAGDSLTPQAMMDVVAGYGRRVLGMHMAPHDLRRSYAKLARAGGSGLDQIQLSLGHASIQTTERYLGVQQDLVDAPGDRLGLRI